MAPNATYFKTYDEAKARIKLEIKLLQEVNKGRKRIKKLMKSTKQASSTLMLPEGKGDDVEDDDEEDEEK